MMTEAEIAAAAANPPPTAEEISLAHGIHLPLARASLKKGIYLIGLRDVASCVIGFQRCAFDRNFIFATLLDVIQGPLKTNQRTNARGLVHLQPPGNAPFKHGFVIRVVDILWAAEQPWGQQRHPNEVPW